MTPKQRLDRLERIARIFLRAGQRARTNIREQHEKINILIDTQNQNEDRFNERFARIEKRFAKNEERFAKTEQAIDRMIAAQARTDQKLQALIDAIRGKGPGESLA